MSQQNFYAHLSARCSRRPRRRPIGLARRRLRLLDHLLFGEAVVVVDDTFDVIVVERAGIQVTENRMNKS